MSPCWLSSALSLLMASSLDVAAWFSKLVVFFFPFTKSEVAATAGMTDPQATFPPAVNLGNQVVLGFQSTRVGQALIASRREGREERQEESLVHSKPKTWQGKAVLHFQALGKVFSASQAAF